MKGIEFAGMIRDLKKQSLDPATHSPEHGAASLRRIAMRNDLDLTRKILESIRDRQDVWPRSVRIAGYDELVVNRHVERLHDDGLIEGPRAHSISDQVATIKVRDLTSAGHQFLSALESGDVWARLKAALDPAELGALSLRELAGIAKELAMRAARQKLGLG